MKLLCLYTGLGVCPNFLSLTSLNFCRTSPVQGTQCDDRLCAFSAWVHDLLISPHLLPGLTPGRRLRTWGKCLMWSPPAEKGPGVKEEALFWFLMTQPPIARAEPGHRARLQEGLAHGFTLRSEPRSGVHKRLLGKRRSATR
ncbi:uncharacterized protein LOC128930196 [Callithrix jacchus]